MTIENEVNITRALICHHIEISLCKKKEKKSTSSRRFLRLSPFEHYSGGTNVIKFIQKPLEIPLIFNEVPTKTMRKILPSKHLEKCFLEQKYPRKF